jgi:hypothetical protein
MPQDFLKLRKTSGLHYPVLVPRKLKIVDGLSGWASSVSWFKLPSKSVQIQAILKIK